MERKDVWTWDDLRAVWLLVLKGMRRQLEGKTHKDKCLHEDEKKDCLAKLKWRDENGCGRKIGALKRKISNFKSALLYIMRHGDEALAKWKEARAEGEKDQYLGKKRITRGLSHGNKLDVAVVMDSIMVKHELSYALILAQKGPANMYPATEAAGPLGYRAVIEKLIQAGTELTALVRVYEALKEPLSPPTAKDCEALDKAIAEAVTLLIETSPKKKK